MQSRCTILDHWLNICTLVVLVARPHDRCDVAHQRAATADRPPLTGTEIRRIVALRFRTYASYGRSPASRHLLEN